MEWWGYLILVLTVPVLLIPFALIWYINVSGIYTVIRETQKRRAAQKKRLREAEIARELVMK